MIINPAPKGDPTRLDRAKAIAEYQAMNRVPLTEDWPFPREIIAVGNTKPKFNIENCEISPY